MAMSLHVLADRVILVVVARVVMVDTGRDVRSH